MSRDAGGAAPIEDPGDPGIHPVDASLGNVAQQAAERLTDASHGPAVATTHLKAVGGARYLNEPGPQPSVQQCSEQSLALSQFGDCLVKGSVYL